MALLGEREKGEKEQELDISSNPVLTETTKEGGVKTGNPPRLLSNTTAIEDEKSALHKEIQTPTSAKSTKGKHELTTKKKGEKEGAHPAGWAIMHPLRMRGMASGKSKKGGSAGEPVLRRSSEDDVDGKKDLKTTATNGTSTSRGVGEIEVLTDMRSDDGLLEEEGENGVAPTERGRDTHLHGVDEREGHGHGDTTVYKVYKRRWFGLVQLVLLNIIVSWDVSSSYRLTIHIQRDDCHWTCTDFGEIVALLLCLLKNNIRVL